MSDTRLFDQDHPDGPPAPRPPAAEREPAGASRPADAYPPAVAVAPPPGEPLDLDRYVRIPSPTGPLRRILAVVIVAVLVLGSLAGGAWVWLQRQIDPPGPPGELVTIEIPNGATSDEIATLLQDEGIIANATVFRYYLRWKGEGDFQAGEYDLVESSALDDVIDVLAAGPAPLEFDRFTVREGLTVAEIQDELVAAIDGIEPADVATALIRMDSPWRPLDVDSWEGLLFPDTYEYAVTDDALAVLSRMNQQFDQVAREVGLDPAMNLDPQTGAPVGLTAYDYVIIASLIEEETRIPEERAQVSRVIHNRLFIGMTLGIDATVLYARGPDRTGPLTSADLDIDSPYNTRKFAGLPPTPIASPGRDSLAAALNPADGDWLYYVLADADGRHFFTDDYDEFLEQKALSEAAGLL
ncbi:MAG TPA: endolytic transglycosylase MltG [Acidimicrobiales bacterium]|nr:endolytic transglycosylase MltG [Acidimicrobiales bacterium]